MIRIFGIIVGALFVIAVCVIASVLLQYVDMLDMMGTPSVDTLDIMGD